MTVLQSEIPELTQLIAINGHTNREVPSDLALVRLSTKMKTESP